MDSGKVEKVLEGFEKGTRGESVQSSFSCMRCSRDEGGGRKDDIPRFDPYIHLDPDLLSIYFSESDLYYRLLDPIGSPLY